MIQEKNKYTLPRIRRSVLLVLVVVGLLLFDQIYIFLQKHNSSATTQILGVETTETAISALQSLPIKGRAPATGYSREEFGQGWINYDDCDTRNMILSRDLTDKVLSADKCLVISGVLNDPYTGKTINFYRGKGTSDDVQIDHVVALSDAWQKGAQLITVENRLALANDPLNLLAVDGPTNIAKSNSDAASWLPPNKSYRCQYVARQIAVKKRYYLWVTKAEYNSMDRILKTCPDQHLPSGGLNVP